MATVTRDSGEPTIAMDTARWSKVTDLLKRGSGLKANFKIEKTVRNFIKKYKNFLFELRIL